MKRLIPLSLVLLVFLGNCSTTNTLTTDPVQGPAKVEIAPGASHQFCQFVTIRYDGKEIMRARTGLGQSIRSRSIITRGKLGQLTQEIILEPKGTPQKPLSISGSIDGSAQAIAVETRHGAQEKFPCVRNVVGRSRNLRNNAIYDRQRDWLLTIPPGDSSWIRPTSPKANGTKYSFETRGRTIRLIFKPNFYRKHKNLSFFKPWKYKIRKDSVSGWCSWWPYRADFNEEHLQALLAVFKEKQLADFGYKYIQIDDAYQQPGCKPSDWLEWNNKFPSGITGYTRAVKEAGFEPGIWIGAMFHDKDFVATHPDWFIPAPDGKPLKAPWLGFGIDTSVPAAVENLVRPIFAGVKKHGFTYVKIDTLRHLLYDAMYHARPHFKKQGISVEEAFRRYIQTAREELGWETFVLACWGVLPEAAGIADGCRLGTDRFGPAKLQQFNSYNGIVWRNDPDHCDILPTPESTLADTIIRPALVSMSGSMLMVSDKAEVYQNDRHLEGMKRAAPVLFTVPGQIYDVDPHTSDNVVKGLRPNTGAGPGPIDAKHERPVVPWWMLEIDRPHEQWTVLARFGFEATDDLPATKVSFADLGLAFGDYHVYEYWSGQYLGLCKESFTAAAQKGKSLRVYAIRRKRDHPQIISTNRHLTQGGPDLLTWEFVYGYQENHMTGTSKVIAGDPYTITFAAKQPPQEATMAGQVIGIKKAGPLYQITLVPEKTGTIEWRILWP